MAKPPPLNPKGKVKFKFVEFELEGSDETLKDSLKSIASAIIRGSSSDRQVPRVISAAIVDASDTRTPAADENIDEAEVAEVEVAEEVEARPRPVKRSPARTPVVVDSLDLRGGDKPLAAFLTEFKVPDEVTKRYLAIALWCKSHRKLDEIGADHVYTCYRGMGWTIPNDPGQPFRDMKKHGWMKSGTAKATFAINHIGEGEVLKMAGANGG